jgi:hypothetical protein
MLWGAVKKAATEWRFAKDAAGHPVEATIEFTLNCPKRNE